jgi:NhaP-type Na+/H+ or K+/H+ antiporter
VQILAVFIYYAVTRYFRALPYTALVFILGLAIGYFTTGYGVNSITDSASLWLKINGQVILLVFLPGLIFLDSFTINVHLFFQSFWQLIIFAFPMVLGGTALTAVFAKYVLPYDWSWNFCMTFGESSQ